ncbi:MAG: EFR1 family ferrodoxin [Kiritimatiellia bacterium]
MTTDIYWFSGTGNSLWLARSLGEILGESELISIAAGVWRGRPAPARAIVVYPAYATRLPKIVQGFLREAPLDQATDLHLVANFALWRAGSLEVGRRLLLRRGLRVRGGFGIRMPNNYTPLGEAAAPAKQQRLFEQAGKRLQEVASVIRDPARQAWESNVLIGRFWAMLCPLMNALDQGEDRKFNSDERCNGCGLCARICPVENIIIRDKLPVWQGHCEMCFRCLQYCPQESIQFQRSTIGRKRYHHPEVPPEAWTA